MKWMIASDLHGSAYYVEKLLQAFAEEKPEKLLLLGDLLYHGARNALPERYGTMDVAEMLNSIKDKLTCVHGNCDSEVDQMVLDFPIGADYALVNIGANTIFATHGHLYDEDCPPHLNDGDVLLCGHTHVAGYREHGKYVYMNPGSVSIPKGGTCHSYMVYEDGLFRWVNLETGETYLRYEMPQNGGN